MNQWVNGSHPQTLRTAVILGYLTAVFGLLGAGGLFLLYIGVGAGAFVTANNKRWGYYLLAVSATLVALVDVVLLGSVARSLSPVPTLFALNAIIFPVALAAAVLHTSSRQYQKVWFD